MTRIRALIARMYASVVDRERVCGYGRRAGEDRSAPCENTYTTRSASAAGHPGYCSAEHATYAQMEQLI